MTEYRDKDGTMWIPVYKLPDKSVLWKTKSATGEKNEYEYRLQDTQEDPPGGHLWDTALVPVRAFLEAVDDYTRNKEKCRE